MNPFGQGFPEPLQSVVNHAERFAIALSLAERDQCSAIGARELTLSETWVIGRAGEVRSFVEDIRHCRERLAGERGGRDMAMPAALVAPGVAV
jgi:hypothetical protein